MPASSDVALTLGYLAEGALWKYISASLLRVLVMDNRPSSIRQELAVDLAHHRDRRDPLLARLKALSLTKLQRAYVT
jgi:ABC-type nitrate/sulfonate/bicarbonate transport system ATPase subunit